MFSFSGTLAHALAAGTESLFPYISLDFKQEEVHIGGVTEHPELDAIGEKRSEAKSVEHPELDTIGEKRSEAKSVHVWCGVYGVLWCDACCVVMRCDALW